MQPTLIDAGPRRQGPLAVSLLLHIGALAPLLLMVQTVGRRPAEMRTLKVTIMAPLPVAPRLRFVRPTSPLRAHASSRTLTLPLLARGPVPLSPMWELPPIVDLPIATPVPMSTSAMPLAMKTPLLPPPVLTTLSFPSAQSQVTQAAKSSELQTGAFSAVQRSGSSGPGSLVTRSAGFSSVNMAASSPPTSFLAPGSAFPEAQAVRRAGPVSNSVASEPYTPVEILYKPRPTYTEPARAAQIEGDVVLEVVFTAGGLVLVKRTLSVLGYGLDEQASAAARAIRFRPATRNGRNVDSPATIHIHFELAN